MRTTTLLVRLGSLVAFSVPFVIAACGSSGSGGDEYIGGNPPDAGYTTGKGNAPTGSGSASAGQPGNTGTSPTSTTTTPPPPPCTEAEKVCDQAFTWPDHGETSVEARGDWGGPATWVAGGGVKLTKSGSMWTGTAPMLPNKAVLYKFVINGDETNGWKVDPAQPTKDDGKGNTNNFLAASCAGATLHCPTPVDPPANVFDWRSAVIYYIFTDRFLDAKAANNCNAPGSSNLGNYMGGDWAGITQKLKEGYFKKLGVTAIMISGPQESIVNAEGTRLWNSGFMATGYHGYWPKETAADKPFSCLGTQADLKDLIAAAHDPANGAIQVLVDVAMVHVHSSSAIFQAHKDWFWNGNGGNIPCGGPGVDNWNTWNGDNWSGDTPGTKCWFEDYLPHWNYTVAAARDFHVSATMDWVKTYGMDGFRADAIKHVDITWLEQLRSQLNAYVAANKPAGTRFFMVGETFDPYRPHLRWHVNPKTRLDGQYEFHTKDDLRGMLLGSTSMSQLSASLDEQDAYYGPDAVMTPFIGSQDTGRVIHVADRNPKEDRMFQNGPGNPGDIAYERLALAYAVMFTNKGAPLIYYGDEIGMAGASDPDNRRMMQWSGVSAAQEGLRTKISKLLELRGKYKALFKGTRATINVGQDTWVWSQTAPSEPTVYVAINRGDGAAQVSGLPSGALTELVSGAAVTGPSDSVPARSYKLYIAK